MGSRAQMLAMPVATVRLLVAPSRIAAWASDSLPFGVSPTHNALKPRLSISAAASRSTEAGSLLRVAFQTPTRPRRRFSASISLVSGIVLHHLVGPGLRDPR
ncbi:hypothetical protein GCM10020220_102350 [Nonomuraea rubra]